MTQKLHAQILCKTMKEMLQKMGAEKLYTKELEEIITFRTILTEETDRGCALISTSFLEHRLGDLIKAFIVNDNKHSKELFEGNGPFSTFSSRINICYSLGLISKTMKSDMNILRKIRNEFAHNPSFISFETSNISDRCKALSFAGQDCKIISSRECFIRAMLGIDGTIFIEMQSLKNIKPKPNEDISEREEMFDFLQNNFDGVFKKT